MIIAMYLRMDEIKERKAKDADKHLLLTGAWSLLSKYISFLPPEMARTGEILPTLPVIMNIKPMEITNMRNSQVRLSPI